MLFLQKDTKNTEPPKDESQVEEKCRAVSLFCHQCPHTTQIDNTFPSHSFLFLQFNHTLICT